MLLIKIKTKEQLIADGWHENDSFGVLLKKNLPAVASQMVKYLGTTMRVNISQELYDQFDTFNYDGWSFSKEMVEGKAQQDSVIVHIVNQIRKEINENI